MEKTEEQQTRLRKIDYKVGDFCILLAPGKYKIGSEKPDVIERMENAIGNELRQAIDIQRLYALKNPKDHGVFCSRENCDNCEIFIEYNSRLGMVGKTLPPISGNFQSIE